MSFPLLRLVTVHPALVHVTLGILPVIVLAYLAAAWRRSERWTFAADVTLVTGAAFTVLTAAFGLVSYTLVEWPGGLGSWPPVHLVVGSATAGALFVFAGLCLARRRRQPRSGPLAAAAAVATAVVGGFTGWVGGEVLVFRSGVAVVAAGEGALAPPVSFTKAEPRDLDDAMGRLRSHWGAVDTRLAQMLVHRPSAAAFDEIADNARAIRSLAQWLSADYAQRVPVGDKREHFTEMARDLGGPAAKLEQAARDRELRGVSVALRDTSNECAECHEHLRWRRPGAPAAHAP